MGWLTNWTYRKPITISNSNGNLSNFQVNALIDTQTLINQGKLLASGNDIRFTDSDGSTLLSFWYQSGINTNSTSYWVQVPSLSSGSYTIYVYYGNNGASNLSSIGNTFIYGDDFSVNTIANYTIGNQGGDNVSVDTVNKWMLFTGNNSHNLVASPTTQTNPASYVVESEISTDNLTTDMIGGILGFKSTLTGGDGYVAQIGNVSSFGNSIDIEKYTVAHLAHTGVTINTNTFYPVKGTFVNANITATFNNVTSVNTNDTTYISGMYGMRTFNPSTHNVKFQNFRVRAYASSDPTVSIGSEQTQGTTIDSSVTTAVFVPVFKIIGY